MFRYLNPFFQWIHVDILKLCHFSPVISRYFIGKCISFIKVLSNWGLSFIFNYFFFKFSVPCNCMCFIFSCTTEFTGPTCTTPKCSSYCYNNGNCSFVGGAPKCSCERPFTGDRCQSNMCTTVHGFCENGGNCSVDAAGSLACAYVYIKGESFSGLVD